MSDEIPQPFDPSSMTPELEQELKASSIAEDFYDLTYGIPNGMQRLTLALMRTTGNGRLATYAEKLAPAYQGEGEEHVRAVELGWSIGYMYHHQLALIRFGRVPVIGLPAMVQWQDEHNTDTGLMGYMRTSLPTRDSTEWVMRNVDAAQNELGLPLEGLMAHVAEREGFMSNPDTLMTILYSTSRINRLFLIHYSLPEDLA